MTSLSPPAGIALSQAKKPSAETLGFRSMGRGKASYLTNVGATVTKSTSNLVGSRNFTSPYASANNMQLPISSKATNSKIVSQSPPNVANTNMNTSDKDSLLVQK